MRKPILRLLLIALIAVGVSIPGWQFASAGAGDDEDTGTLLHADSLLGGTLELLNCDDGGIARWQKAKLTFKIDNAAKVDARALDAMRKGVTVWNKAKAPYTLTEVTSGTADITITTVKSLRTPTIIGRADVTCKTARAGITEAAVSLKLTGLSNVGMKNLTTHEIGHALGLGHSNRTGDLMSPNYEKLLDGLLPICPSNLDVQGFTAKQDPHKILPVLWLMLPIC